MEINKDDNNPEPMDMDTEEGNFDGHEEADERDKRSTGPQNGKNGYNIQKETIGSSNTQQPAPAKQAVVGQETEPVVADQKIGPAVVGQAAVAAVVGSAASIAGRTTGRRQVFHLRIPGFVAGQPPVHATQQMEHVEAVAEEKEIVEEKESLVDEPDKEQYVEAHTPRMTESELSAELKDIAAQWTPNSSQDVTSMAVIPEAATGSSVSRRSKRRADTVDEDTGTRAERLKACRNLETEFVEGNQTESFLHFSDSNFISNLHTVGISLGVDDSDTKQSINLLKNVEKERLENRTKQDVKTKAIDLDEREGGCRYN